MSRYSRRRARSVQSPRAHPRQLLLVLLTAAMLAGVMAAAGPAAAQSEPTQASIQAMFRGAAPAGCRLSTPNAPTTDNAQVAALAPGSADIAINQLVDAAGAPIGATIVLVLPAVCNQAHTLNLSSLHGGLLGDGGAAAGGPFRSELPYTVTVAWAGNQQSFLTTDGAMAFALGEASTGVVTVTIQIPAGGAPLVAGAYSDELVLELGVAG